MTTTTPASSRSRSPARCRKKDNPAVPITVAEQVESTQAAFEAGATLVHLHVRNDDGTPTSAPERFAAVPRRHPQALPGNDHAGLDRRPLGRRARSAAACCSLRPDMASLATGSVNFPTRVYDNAPDLVDWLASEMKTLRHQARGRGVRPVDDLPGGGDAEERQDRRRRCTSSS